MSRRHEPPQERGPGGTLPLRHAAMVAAGFVSLGLASSLLLPASQREGELLVAEVVPADADQRKRRLAPVPVSVE